MILYGLDDRCPYCGGDLGVGTKEEPGGWKVYAMCLTDGDSCLDRRVGTVSRRTVEHADDVHERAREMVRSVV